MSLLGDLGLQTSNPNGGLSTTGTSSNSTGDLDETTGAKIQDNLDKGKAILENAGNILTGAGDLLCAIKGNCENTTVIQEAPPKVETGSNTGLIIGLVLGIPTLIGLAIFFWKFATKK